MWELLFAKLYVFASLYTIPFPFSFSVAVLKHPFQCSVGIFSVN